MCPLRPPESMTDMGTLNRASHANRDLLMHVSQVPNTPSSMPETIMLRDQPESNFLILVLHLQILTLLLQNPALYPSHDHSLSQQQF